MRDLTPDLIELIRRASTDLPPDVQARLHAALESEESGSAAHTALTTILANVEMARQKVVPICQDTGTPIFYVHYPQGWSQRRLTQQIKKAVAEATSLSLLRPNAVDSLSGKNSGDNLGDAHFPAIHFTEVDGDILSIDLLLKGGGCENVGAQYSLPDASLKAWRDLEGVRKVTLDAVHRAQGEGCAPGFLGVAIGGDRGTSYLASKEVFLRKVDQSNPNPDLSALAERLTDEANQLGIGPMGFGGNSTVLGTQITTVHRLPASFFVTISYMCWAFRRRRMVVEDSQVSYT
jgi:fumarate hydratase class I